MVDTWLLSLTGAAGGALLMAVLSGFRPTLTAAGAIVGFVVPRACLSFRERRRRRMFDAQLLDAIPLVAGAMKAGMSLPQAMGDVTREMGPPLRQEVARALQENRGGKPFVQCLNDMKSRIRSYDLNTTVDAIGITEETGGVLSDLLLKMAEAIRARNRIRAKINMLSVRGRTQGIIMILLPWLLAAAASVLDRDLMRPMFTTSIGQVTLVIIAALEFVGWLFIRRLVAIDV